MRAENHPLFPLVVVADCWLQRLLVWTPGQTDLIKTVALLLMVADHISMLCGLDNDWLRLAGRGAFPLFGLVWAMNLARHPQIQQRALNRLGAVQGAGRHHARLVQPAIARHAQDITPGLTEAFAWRQGAQRHISSAACPSGRS
mgnify:CR=1 FL=1